MKAPPISIVLPIGISFFTFQLACYLVDVARGDAHSYPWRRVTLFVSLFPHLIAGPIVRHHQIMPQLDADPLRPGLAERFAKGLAFFIIGCAKKVFLADPMARFADPIFAAAATSTPSLVDAWHGALAFSFQLFLDFSAYSEMAIGLGLMLGVRFPDNFDMPYRASDLANFWRRWHMTLSQLIRDYLYIPLGGSRHGWGTYVKATLLSMGLCGLWHGAGWTYVAWGLMHGVGLVVCRAWQQKAFPLPAAVGWALTMLFVLAGWVLFRSPDFATAGHMLMGMAGLGGGFGPTSCRSTGCWPSRSSPRCWCPPPSASSKAAGCSRSPTRPWVLRSCWSRASWPSARASRRRLFIFSFECRPNVSAPSSRRRECPTGRSRKSGRDRCTAPRTLAERALARRGAAGPSKIDRPAGARGTSW